MKHPLNTEQTEAKAAAKKAKKQRQKAARQQTQLAQQAPPADHTQQEPQARQLDQEAQQAHCAQQAQQLDQEAQHSARYQQAKLLHGHEQTSQQPSEVAIHDLHLCCVASQSARVHAAAGHDQSRAAQSMPHCSDATGLQPAQTRGLADHAAASLQRPSTGDDLESGRLDAAMETDASQTDGYLCDEASAALFLQQLVCCPLTQVRLRTQAPCSS